MSFHSEHVATYSVDGEIIRVYLCWCGDDDKKDDNRFYDFFNEEGACINLGEPWFDDDEGIPSWQDVKEAFGNE